MSADRLRQLAGLSPAKQALLARRLAHKAPHEIPRVRRDAPMLASFAQESFWFVQQLEPLAPTFNLASVFHLSGKLDVAALSRAIDELARRHEILRTTFELVDGRLALRVDAAPTGVLCIEHAEALTDAELNAREEREARTPFDLRVGPLFRARLLHRAETAHVLLLTMHHTIGDDWSWGIIERELVALYSAFARGLPNPLPPVELQYADYAAWQRDVLAGPRLAELVQFWKTQLDGAPTGLALPTDHPRRALQHHASDVFELAIPRHVTAALTELARARGATLNMALAAAFGAFLSSLTGQREVVIGSPIAVRQRSQLESLVGLFVNNLAIRVSMAGDPTFRELLDHTAKAHFDAFAHAELPFSLLIGALGGARDNARNPVYQTMFAFYSKRAPAVAVDGVSFVRSERERKRSTVLDLVLMLIEGPEGVRGVFEYDTTLFEAQTAERLRDRFVELLERLAMDPDCRIGTLAPARFIDAWNRTERAYPRDQLVHELVADQAARTPDAIAVSFEDTRLTYRDLDERATRVAARLRERGVGPETLVGVAMERSLELVVALLGILKAGGAYVPLDPGYPQERVRYMIDDAGATIVLTRDDVLRWQATSVERFVAPAIDLEHLAYVIYTSGSTGRPKGAMNRHVAILNRLQWMQDAYAIGPGDVVMQKTPYSFDVSVWEFFWPLMTGARLVVARPDGHKDAGYLCDLIEREQVTTLHFVPSMLSVFVEVAGVERCRSLRHVVASGEALPLALAERFHARLPWAALHNLYGPTEAAVDVSAYTCRWENEPSIPIGRPIANVQLHVLDAALAPAPIGEAGELYIGGIAVGRGYWRRRALTAERFVPDPLGPPGSRLYRTGDVASRRSDGEIEYQGRGDHQVKIRGFRIELGEIEAALAAHPGVRDAVVLVYEPSPGDKRLAAYLVAPESPPTADDLRERLRTELPEYMIPSAFVVVDELPVTPNGKLDRSALAALPIAVSTTSSDPGANEVERQIMKIWCEVLHVDEVGLDDDFFDLGGHSLLLTQLAARIERELGVALSLRVLFDDPTVSGVAAAVVASQIAGLENLIEGVESLSAEEVEALLRTSEDQK